MAFWYGLLAVAVILNGIANILMKAGMRETPELNGPAALINHYLHSWPVMLGLCLFALNVLAYTQALSRIPLSVAYPIMVTLGFAIIVVVAGLYLDERPTRWQWVGVTFILIGVWLVAWEAGDQLQESSPSPIVKQE